MTQKPHLRTTVATDPSRGEQLIVREGSDGDPHTDRSGRVDPLSGVEELGGPLAPDGLLQRVAAGQLGDQTQVGERQPHPEPFPHVHDVGVEQEGGATTHGDPGGGGDQGFVERHHGVGTAREGRVLDRSDRAAAVGRARSVDREGVQVLTGREVPAGSRQQHDAHRPVLPGPIQRFAQAVPERVVEGVPALGPVECRDQEAVVAFGQDPSFGHRGPPYWRAEASGSSWRMAILPIGPM